MGSRFIVAQELHMDPNTSIVMAKCNFNNKHFCMSLFDLFGISFPPELVHAVTKRKSEYFIGRYMASIGLKKMQVNTLHVPIGKHREPIWPSGVTGSITHTKDMAICVLANRNQLDYLGIDLENVFEDSVVEMVKDKIINPQEALYLKTQDLDFKQALTTIFSAKETLFKALFPYVGEYFNFDCAELSRIDVNKQLLFLRITKDLCSQALRNTIFKVSFEINNSHVRTLMYGKFNS